MNKRRIRILYVKYSRYHSLKKPYWWHVPNSTYLKEFIKYAGLSTKFL